MHGDEVLTWAAGSGFQKTALRDSILLDSLAVARAQEALLLLTTQTLKKTSKMWLELTWNISRWIGRY